ncbi:NICE-3 protein domain-containing protein [Ditylenchus destructor]|uniref:NICE-3 protein domain-containing protein n=1 Tax=Ditylenchus destructor TaxID=166010 RepID=A0AAD4MVD5_9BILA|nr:NICE-3 protein domain-containing protein [Ditylenchus destructor]
MRGMMTLSLGGYTVIFAVTFLMLVAVLFGIFVYRQIQRLRNNSARKEINSSVALELSKKGREAIMKKIEAVHCFRKIHFPKFTDCTMISEHANSPYDFILCSFNFR